jgi:hypothetical protein
MPVLSLSRFTYMFQALTRCSELSSETHAIRARPDRVAGHGRSLTLSWRRWGNITAR